MSIIRAFPEHPRALQIIKKSSHKGKNFSKSFLAKVEIVLDDLKKKNIQLTDKKVIEAMLDLIANDWPLSVIPTLLPTPD